MLNLENALQVAKDEQLDLVEIDANANPPVVKLLDYKKFLFKKNKTNAISGGSKGRSKLKEVKFRMTIGESDYNIKLRNVVSFLKKKKKVRVSVLFRGREISHKEPGLEILNGVVESVRDYGTVKDSPKFEGKQLTVLVEPL